jgi:hypothetical protein
VKRISIIVALIAIALVTATAAWATDPPDDGQNGPDPTPGSYVETPPDLGPDGEVWCGITQYNPWKRYYAPWDIWYVQARSMANCKYKSGSIWLPFNAWSIYVESKLYRAYPYLSYNLVDTDTSTVVNDSITSAKNVHNCTTYRSGNVKYQLHTFVLIDLDGVQEINPYEYEFDKYSPEFAYSNCG